jgi:hypothetical protein
MKKKKTGFILKICVALSLVLAIFTGGYLFLDKKIVPKYFGKYGIYGIPDLVGVVASLYKSPNESKIVTNAFTQTDFSNAVSKLQNSGYKMNNDGSMQKTEFDDFKGDQTVIMTDRELASICNKFLSDGILVDALPDLNYLNIINISVLEIIITPDKDSFDGEFYTKAHVSSIMKINTTDICEQIAEQMDTPLFLLNMIIPEVLYFEVAYDIDLDKESAEESAIVDASGSIAINGRSEKQSEILINLLIDFIFPDNEDMNIDKFTNELGNVIVSGIEILGDFKFAGENSTQKKQNGVMVNPLV